MILLTTEERRIVEESGLLDACKGLVAWYEDLPEDVKQRIRELAPES